MGILTLEQNSSTRDVIDLFKTVFDIDEISYPRFVSKINICLVDFKTWKLEKEIQLNQLNPQQLKESRDKINSLIEDINNEYPFAHLKPENKIFFEGFKRAITNNEFEASQTKLIELSNIFSSQNKDLENMAKKERYAIVLSVVGIVVGICGIFLH